MFFAEASPPNQDLLFLNNANENECYRRRKKKRPVWFSIKSKLFQHLRN